GSFDRPGPPACGRLAGGHRGFCAGRPPTGASAEISACAQECRGIRIPEDQPKRGARWCRTCWSDRGLGEGRAGIGPAIEPTVLTAMTPLSLAADQTSQPPYPTKAFTPRTPNESAASDS